MKNIVNNLHSEKEPSIADYFNLYKKIQSNIDNLTNIIDQKIKIAILSSFTVNGIKEVLSVELLKLKTNSQIYVAGYNQYNQEILNENSELYKFAPDLIIILIDTNSLLGDTLFFQHGSSDENLKQTIETKLSEILNLISIIKSRLNSKIIINNFEIPTYSPLGILENKQEFGLIESIEFLNNNLRDNYKKDYQVFVYNFDSFCSKIGKQKIIDHKMYYLADLKIDIQILPELCKDYMGYLIPILSLSKKCLVLDLDNTLWGGILGEDGIEGIKLGIDPLGKPFYDFQKQILALHKRGIILAVNSKNNFEEVVNVLENHEHMLLKKDNFASIKANWNDKVTNLIEISRDINIGLDSIVFMDDDKSNCEMVKSSLPEVKVINMPEDPCLYPNILTTLPDFNILQLTKEDLTKGKSYNDNLKREKLLQNCINLDDYLTKLNIIVSIELVNPFNIPRISQLTQKTNQFNLTTKRYMEEDIHTFMIDPAYLILAVKVEDKYGDYGITGAVIIKKINKIWEIDLFLISCRVIGKKIEEAMLEYIVGKANVNDIEFLDGYFIPTAKNNPAKDFFSNCGFDLIESNNNHSKWRLTISKGFKKPEYINIMER